jgi:hypothetical protein
MAKAGGHERRSVRRHVPSAKEVAQQKSDPWVAFYLGQRRLYFLDPPSNLIMSAPSPNDSKPVCA